MNPVVCTGLFYGDEGKGTITAYLAEELPDVRVVVRHSGGCQAAHNVVTADGRHHTFAQFGSGTFTPGVRTHLSHLMMVNPYNFYPEEEHLRSLGVPDAWGRLTVDRDCLVTTPLHAQANRHREALRGDNKHGTCGVGIGETRQWHNTVGEEALFVRDLHDRSLVKKKLETLHNFYRYHFWPTDFDLPSEEDLDLYVDFSKRSNIVSRDELAGIVGDGTVIFEGAQGVLLDEKHGFQPHTTWSTTTSKNARTILRDDLDQDPGDAMYIGVTRTYSTRHGAGPFIPGDQRMDIPETHNNADGHQGEFRTGPWDELSAIYVSDVDQPTHLAVTYCDALTESWPICFAYKEDQSPAIDYLVGDEVLPHISAVLGAPVLIESHGPRTNHKKMLALV